MDVILKDARIEIDPNTGLIVCHAKRTSAPVASAEGVLFIKGFGRNLW